MVDLRCPECLTWMQGCFSRDDMKELDRLQTAGREEIQSAYEQQVAESMEALIDCLHSALALDLVGPDDFAPRPAAPAAARGLAASAKPRRHGAEGDEQRRAERCDRLLDREAADVSEAHWKISVVQSPPWRRTSWARAGPSGRSWRSTKKSGSISIPPSGSQLTRSSHERSSG